MTDRERWTVYPLLFMTLGIAVKDKIVRIVSVDEVSCAKLVVTDREGLPQVVIASSPSGGLLSVQRGQAQHAGAKSYLLGYVGNAEGLMMADAQGNVHSVRTVVPGGGPRRAPRRTLEGLEVPLPPRGEPGTEPLPDDPRENLLDEGRPAAGH